MSGEMTLTDTLVSSVADSSPAVLALTLAYAKLHIRALGTADDMLTTVRIQAAASYFEEQTGRPVLTQTRQAGLSGFPFVGASGSDARIELPHPPLQRVQSVKYIDGNGVLQSFAGGSPVAPYWRAVTYPGAYGQRGYVEPLYGMTWPTARAETDSVRILYDCGYSSTSDAVPPLVKGILCYLCAHFDQFPSATQVGTVNALPLGLQVMMDGFKYSALSSQVLREYGTWLRGTSYWMPPYGGLL